MSQMRKEMAGEYQIGIWNITKQHRGWLAVATGPGTLGDGSPHCYPTLAAAYFALTGERMPGARRGGLIGERSTCTRCGQELEWTGNKWWDRGGDTTCGSYMERGELIKEDHTKPHVPAN